MTTFRIKKGDTLPAIEAVLSTSAGVVDLTAATAVYLVLKEKGTDGALVFKKAGSIVAPATAGTVKYAWAADDTAVVGKYNAEFEVHFGSDVQTFPTVGSIPVSIGEDCG